MSSVSTRWAPDPVVSGIMTRISIGLFRLTHLFSAIYRGLTSLMQGTPCTNKQTKDLWHCAQSFTIRWCHDHGHHQCNPPWSFDSWAVFYTHQYRTYWFHREVWCVALQAWRTSQRRSWQRRSYSCRAPLPWRKQRFNYPPSFQAFVSGFWRTDLTLWNLPVIPVPKGLDRGKSETGLPKHTWGDIGIPKGFLLLMVQKSGEKTTEDLNYQPQLVFSPDFRHQHHSQVRMTV